MQRSTLMSSDGSTTSEERVEAAPTIQITVVREKGGKRVRCIYIGHLRVWGSKPYVTENLPHEFFDVPMSEIDNALHFERAYGKVLLAKGARS